MMLTAALNSRMSRLIWTCRRHKKSWYDKAITLSAPAPVLQHAAGLRLPPAPAYNCWQSAADVCVINCRNVPCCSVKHEPHITGAEDLRQW